MQLATYFLVLLLAAPTVLLAQDYTVVFEGRPIRKVESSFESTIGSALTADNAFKYAVRIVERQGKYYWASRDMRELARHESGAFSRIRHSMEVDTSERALQ
jgi:hypothetical protein